MKRREFLVGTAAGAAALAGMSSISWAQGGQAPAAPAAPGRGRQAGPGRGGPAQVAPEKLARVSLMTLNFGAYMIPANGTPTTADQTLTVFDLPKMYVDMYGVHNIEYQHSAIVKSETDPAFIKELKAKLDDNKMTMTLINLEFGGSENIAAIVSAQDPRPNPAGRQKAIDHTKQWIDIAVQYGCPRVMINQNQAYINKDTRADAIAAWKAMADYGKTKNVKVSAETRGAGTPDQVQAIGMKTWQYMAGIIEAAGAASNVDIGNVAAANQQELHDCIKAWFPYSSGNMHIKSSPNWNIGAAVKFTESLGYKGLYSIEVSTHPAVRIVYNEILAALP
jgi:sugar phosphate isomerase/epimerase